LRNQFASRGETDARVIAAWQSIDKPLATKFKDLTLKFSLNGQLFDADSILSDRHMVDRSDTDSPISHHIRKNLFNKDSILSDRYLESFRNQRYID
jgi:hypothetical protein